MNSSNETHTCSQQLREGGKCEKPAVSSVMWPGHDEPTYSCEEHDKQIRGLCRTMGWSFQFKDLTQTQDG